MKDRLLPKLLEKYYYHRNISSEWLTWNIIKVQRASKEKDGET